MFADGYGLAIDAAGREALLNGRPLSLTRTEFDLLVALSNHPRVVLSPEQLLGLIDEGTWMSGDHPIEVHISRLRTKLGESGNSPHFIHTIRGVGYRFEPHDQDGIRTYIEYDADLIVRLIRPLDRLVLGFEPREIVDTFFMITASKELRTDQTKARAFVDTLIAAGVRRLSGADIGSSALGDEVPVNVEIQLLTDATGKFAGMHGYIVELTR